MSSGPLPLLAALLVAAAVVVLRGGEPSRRLDRARRARGAVDLRGSAAVRELIAAARRRVGGAAARSRRAGDALEVGDALAAELRAGREVREALVLAAGEPAVCPQVVAAARMGGDVVAALRAQGERDGVRLWLSLAACWSVGEGSGAGLARAVDRVVSAARADEEVRREVRAALAAPRATARVLAVLPLVGLALGTALGASPLAWLTGSPAGVLCLLAGLACAAAGVVWTSHLAAAVERRL